MEAEQELPGVQFGSYPQYNQQQEQVNQLIKAQFDTTELMKNVKHFLLGIEEDHESGTLVKIHNAQLINERGARALLFELQNKLSPQLVLSQMTAEEAKKRALIFELDLLEELASNYIIWELNGLGAVYTIQNALGDIVFANFTRPIESKAFNGLVNMGKIMESQQIIQREQMPQEKKGFLNKILGLGG